MPTFATDPYQLFLRPLLFSVLQVDPEASHRWVMAQLEQLSLHGQTRWGKAGRSFLHHNCCTRDSRLEQRLWNLDFPNPVGLAAGFDKDGLATPVWQDFGFGFAELGTVTRHAQPGNPLPRLFRLLADRAVLNRMGFNNAGAIVLAERLEQFAQIYAPVSPAQPEPYNKSPWGIPLGINLGKSKITPLEEAIEDYRFSFQALQNWGDYFVINVSSPNTPGLRNLQAREQLEPLCAALQADNVKKRPLFVKIAPDLEWDAIEDVMVLVQQYGLAGIIATNTTLDRSGLTSAQQILKRTGRSIAEEAGGISGLPLRDRSTAIIRFITCQSHGAIPIIGVGGIFTAEDAWEKLISGASLVQVYTGWIYQGPWMLKTIMQGLGQKLDDHGFKHLSEAIGCGV